MTGLFTCVEECVSDKECILAYLPLAHIFEMALENLVLFIGGTLGYGNPRTLADSMVKNCFGDMHEFRPTVMVGVPQIWETVKKGVVSKLETASPVLRGLFWTAFNFKGFMTRNKLPGANIFDNIVFSKVRELTGGRLRFTMNGASGISDGTKHFLSLVLAPMLTGYGLTETCANGSLGCPLEYSPNAIGPIPSSCEAKLVSIPDLGYSADSTPPQGEIWLRGLPIMTKYWDNQEETEKALTPDGWFKTGDIGEFDADGHLRVFDRVKNLVKMQGGEYIALEKLEAVYRGAQTVANVMVHADPEYSRPIAIIMPNEKVLVEKAKELGVHEDNIHTMHHNAKVRNFVLKDLQTAAKRAGLVSMETVSGVVITDEEWIPDSVRIPRPSFAVQTIANNDSAGPCHRHPEAEPKSNPRGLQEGHRRVPQEHCLSDVIRDVGGVGRDRRSGRSENGWMDGWTDGRTRDTRREGSMIACAQLFMLALMESVLDCMYCSLCGVGSMLFYRISFQCLKPAALSVLCEWFHILKTLLALGPPNMPDNVI